MKFNQSNLLKQFSNITSVFTTKKSGNLAFHVGDVTDNVVKNHKLLANELSYELQTLIHMRQVHSNSIHKVTQNDNFTNPPTCDALITDKKNTPLLVMVADCAPLLFYDAKNKVIAVAHAGRAGAFRNIVQNVLNCFTKEYDSSIDEIYVSVGTCIQKCCYEVGCEVDKEAKKLNLDYAIEKREGSYYLDIPTILKKQLKDAGVKEQNIEFSLECSACTTDKHYSYRAEKETGRFAGLIYLKA